jgi:hypothetical protein
LKLHNPCELRVFLAENDQGSTSRFPITPCGKKKARPDIDEPPFRIFKTKYYLIVIGHILPTAAVYHDLRGLSMDRDEYIL